VKKGRKYRIRELWKLKNKKWVKTKRSYMRRVRKAGGRRFRRYRKRFQWRWGKKTRTVRKRLFRRRILFVRTRSGKYRPTKRAYWRRVRKQKRCVWKWAGSLRKIKGKMMRKRVLVCLVKGKWQVKKSYWRKVRHLRRRKYLRRWAWRWGKNTKRKGAKLYRVRRLFRKRHGRWYKTKRWYWRTVKRPRRYKSRKTRRATRRYKRHRRKTVFRWRWGKATKKVKGRRYRKRILFRKGKGGRWFATKRSYFRLVNFRPRKHKVRRYQWRWGNKRVTKNKRMYRSRVLWTMYRGKWRPTKRSYMRLLPSLKKGKKCMWKWGKAMKRTRRGLFRKRVKFCLSKKTKKMTATKRSYWRRITSYKRRRYKRRNAFSWRWSVATKKSRKTKRLYRRRVLYKKTGRNWRPTRRAYWRWCKSKKCKNWKPAACKTVCKTKVIKGKKVCKKVGKKTVCHVSGGKSTKCKRVCKKAGKNGKKAKKGKIAKKGKKAVKKAVKKIVKQAAKKGGI